MEPPAPAELLVPAPPPWTGGEAGSPPLLQPKTRARPVRTGATKDLGGSWTCMVGSCKARSGKRARSVARPFRARVHTSGFAWHSASKNSHGMTNCTPKGNLQLRSKPAHFRAAARSPRLWASDASDGKRRPADGSPPHHSHASTPTEPKPERSPGRSRTPCSLDPAASRRSYSRG